MEICYAVLGHLASIKCVFMAHAATLTKHIGNSLFLLFFFKYGFDVLIRIHCQTLWL